MIPHPTDPHDVGEWTRQPGTRALTALELERFALPHRLTPTQRLHRELFRHANADRHAG